MQSIVVSTISKITAFDTPAMQRITTSNKSMHSKGYMFRIFLKIQMGKYG